MNTLKLSRRIAALAPSSTTAAAKKAKALAASGVDVVDFSIGEPDFATPEFVGRAGVRAIETGRTKYTDVAGDTELREAIAAKYRREQAAPASRENVIVTAGAKQAVFNVCQALFEEGDEVALFAPYWVSFPEMVRLTGATPVFAATALASYQSHTTSNASSISQAAALAALTDLENSAASVEDMLSHYRARRDVMVAALTAIPGVRCGMPEGAFYAFADVSALYPRMGVRGSAAFCDRLLAEAHVATVPGDAFGEDACVRFSYATPTERIREGMRRLAAWAKS